MEPKNEAAALTTERIEKLKAHLENNAFAQICGIKVAEMRYDYVKMTAEVRPELLNPLGRVHGGMLYTLADCCSGLSNVAQGHLEAESRVIRRGRTVCVLDIAVRCPEENKLLAEGIFTMYAI